MRPEVFAGRYPENTNYQARSKLTPPPTGDYSEWCDVWLDPSPGQTKKRRQQNFHWRLFDRS
jgi:hypothetical protein